MQNKFTLTLSLLKQTCQQRRYNQTGPFLAWGFIIKSFNTVAADISFCGLVFEQAWSDGLPTDFYGLVMNGLLDLSEEGDCAMANIVDGRQSTLMSTNCNKKLQYICELSACPAGWTSYFGNCYRYFDESKSWIEAKGHCQGYQRNDFIGQLVSIATDDFSR